MELACIFSAGIDTPDHIARAEQLGYSGAWVTDSPSFMADPWITLARAAERTSQIRLGVCALTPRLRHVVATAGAAATLEAVAHGRVDIVVGTGFTSQAMLNKRPARWGEAEAYVRALRGLLAGEEIEWDGEMIASALSPSVRNHPPGRGAALGGGARPQGPSTSGVVWPTGS